MACPRDSVESAPPLLPSPKPGRVFWAWLLPLFLVLLLGGAVFFSLSRLRSRVQPAPAVIASFRADFQKGTPKERWKYLWNANGPVGSASSYAELHWNGNLYSVDPAVYPAPPPGRYLRLTSGGGHPGQGPSQGREVGNDEDRCVIVAFEVTDRGSYWITNSVVSRHVGSRSGSVHLRVFVNDREAGPLLACRSKPGQSFDRALGTLAPGDTIYVTVGPNEVDTDDSFDLDFAIAR
jgi:hypothetical protein